MVSEVRDKYICIVRGGGDKTQRTGEVMVVGHCQLSIRAWK